MPKRSSKTDDINKLAANIVSQATGQEGSPVNISISAAALGRLGGLKGGPARAKALSKAKRKAIAKIAAAARWGKTKD